MGDVIRPAAFRALRVVHLPHDRKKLRGDHAAVFGVPEREEAVGGVGVGNAQFFTVVGKVDNEIPGYAAMPQMEE